MSLLQEFRSVHDDAEPEISEQYSYSLCSHVYEPRRNRDAAMLGREIEFRSDPVKILFGLQREIAFNRRSETSSAGKGLHSAG